MAETDLDRLRVQYETLRVASLEIERALTDQLQKYRSEAADGWKLAVERGRENGRLRQEAVTLTAKVAELEAEVEQLTARV